MHRCETHPTRDAVCRVETRSAAGAPVSHTLCELCITALYAGFESCGTPPGTEVIWHDPVDELKSRIADLERAHNRGVES